jgi:hypothetical protein
LGVSKVAVNIKESGQEVKKKFLQFCKSGRAGRKKLCSAAFKSFEIKKAQVFQPGPLGCEGEPQLLYENDRI